MPKYVIVSSSQYSMYGSGTSYSFLGWIGFLNGCTQLKPFEPTNSYARIKVSYGEKSISWYLESNNYGYAGYQLNDNGQLYFWIAFL